MYFRQMIKKNTEFYLGNADLVIALLQPEPCQETLDIFLSAVTAVRQQNAILARKLLKIQPKFSNLLKTISFNFDIEGIIIGKNSAFSPTKVSYIACPLL